MLCGFCCAAPNINDGHCIISPGPSSRQPPSSRLRQHPWCTVGTSLGRAAHILLGYTPSYTGGISLRPEPCTQRLFPTLELYTQEQAGPSRPNNRRRNYQDRTVIIAAQQGKVDLLEGIPQVRLSDSGASSSGRVTHISPSDYFVDPNMSRSLNLAATICHGRSIWVSYPLCFSKLHPFHMCSVILPCPGPWLHFPWPACGCSAQVNSLRCLWGCG